MTVTTDQAGANVVRVPGLLEHRLLLGPHRRVLTGRVLTGRVLTGRVLTGHVPAGRVPIGRLPAGPVPTACPRWLGPAQASNL